VADEQGGRPGAAGPFDDAQRLLAAVQEWAQRALPAPPSGHPGPECQWCPLCQLASVLRGEHPEIAERLAEAGTAVTGAVRALLETTVKHVPQPGGGPGASDAPAPRPRPTPKVQHIDLDGPQE
jgi:hypothetical protein